MPKWSDRAIPFRKQIEDITYVIGQDAQPRSQPFLHVMTRTDQYITMSYRMLLDMLLEQGVRALNNGVVKAPGPTRRPMRHDQQSCLLIVRSAAFCLVAEIGWPSIVAKYDEIKGAFLKPHVDGIGHPERLHRLYTELSRIGNGE